MQSLADLFKRDKDSTKNQQGRSTHGPWLCGTAGNGLVSPMHELWPCEREADCISAGHSTGAAIVPTQYHTDAVHASVEGTQHCQIKQQESRYCLLIVDWYAANLYRVI